MALRAAIVAAACALIPLVPEAAAAAPCRDDATPSASTARLRAAVAAKRDVLGEQLLRAAAGPTYGAVRRLLPPLHYARGPRGRQLTRSGAHYVPFGFPVSVFGVKTFALHVADGSQIVTRRIGGPDLTLLVGNGHELYGACVRRLGGPRLADGSLPILQTTYVDANRVSYRQESFAGRVPGLRPLVSFLRLEVDARLSGGPTVVRFRYSPGSRSRLAYEAGGSLVRRELRYRVEGTRVIHVAWLHQPKSAAHVVDEALYRAARDSLVRFWDAKLAPAATFDLPERVVVDAYRTALVQQRSLTWRYSVGNTYEELSFAEALDAARVVQRYGLEDVSEAILRFAARRLPVRYANWRAGALLVAAASHVELGGALPPPVLRALRGAFRRLEGQIQRRGGSGLLDREQFSSDVRRRVTALHGQAIAWQGLRASSRVWLRHGRPELARRAARAARRLEGALRRAIAASEARLSDGSLFVPAALLDGGGPFDRLTSSREGSYWNLVTPYALASGLLPAKDRRARGIWRYMQAHGAQLLGLVRADARRLYRDDTPHTSGVDQVYGLNVARFLADADLPDQLVLSLYGTLAGAMAPGTFVGGEAATVVPLGRARRGSMYLPPNGGTTTAFLETLRLMLVHERRDGRGAPIGLELAFATPRAWLRPGATIGVQGVMTSLGPVSFTITRRRDLVEASVVAPTGAELRLRLRLPTDSRLAGVESAGRPIPFDAVSGTITLPRGDGRIEVVARLRP